MYQYRGLCVLLADADQFVYLRYKMNVANRSRLQGAELYSAPDLRRQATAR
jgi:hypothetical protein